MGKIIAIISGVTPAYIDFYMDLDNSGFKPRLGSILTS